MTISAPIPVPGTQQEPTTPSLGSTTSTTIIHINSGNSGDLHKNNSNGTGGARITTTTIGTSTPVGVGLVGSNNHLGSSSSNGNASNHHKDDSKDGRGSNSGVGGGLRRFPSIGNTRKLHLENSTLRSKIAELERYLQGLKEELILAHRQIHAKNLEAKISQERKAVEIHELGQHIQRCEFDLLAKTAECEALQNKLQYQTKEQVSKLKHINMLETEIMDYRRMSIMSGYGPASASISGPSTYIGPGGGIVARGGSVLFRNSRNSSDLSESVRSSTVLQENSAAVAAAATAAAVEEATAALQAQIKQLKDEHWKKDEQILELSGKIQFLTDTVSQLKEDASSAFESTLTAAETAVAVNEEEVKEKVKEKEEEKEEEKEGEKEEEKEEEKDDAKVTTMMPTTSMTDKNHIGSESTSDASFNTATTGGGESSDVPHSSSDASIVHNVGYDLTVEHPKVLSQYQVQHAQATEYVGELESKNQEMKVQPLDVSDDVVVVDGEASDVDTPTTENPEPIASIPEPSSSSVEATKGVEEEVKEVEEIEEVEEATTPTFTTAVTSPVIAPSISRNSLHHPAASGLAPLDTVAANAETTTTVESAVSASSSASNHDGREESSPTSAVTSASSPSTVVAAPALTRKSSLRYSRDGQVLPTLNATTTAAATTNAP
jgi:hypothetical protein